MHRLLAVLVPCLLAACSGGPARATPQPTAEQRVIAPARLLVDRMLTALDRQDADAWGTLLSSRMRDRLANDPAALHDHLMVWRRDLLPLAGELRAAELVLDGSGAEQVIAYASSGRTPRALAQVVLEDGVLRLDEN